MHSGNNMVIEEIKLQTLVLSFYGKLIQVDYSFLTYVTMLNFLVILKDVLECLCVWGEYWLHHNKTKYIASKYLFMRKYIDGGLIVAEKVHMLENCANMFS